MELWTIAVTGLVAVTSAVVGGAMPGIVGHFATRATRRADARAALEGEMRERAESFVAAVVAVRELPAPGDRHAPMYSASERAERAATVNSAYAALLVRFPRLAEAAREVERYAYAGAPSAADELFLEAVRGLSAAVDDALAFIG